jgi:hypothetical protein
MMEMMIKKVRLKRNLLVASLQTWDLLKMQAALVSTLVEEIKR